MKKSRQADKKKVFLAPERRFDPNQYQKNDWIKLGLSEKQVAVVLKFTEKGLYSNDDLEKIFVIPSILFNLIKDSTYYPTAPIKKQEFPEKKLLVTHEMELNINTASEKDLLGIKGLGPYFAKAILKYKAELGGFVRKSQLMEIFKMSNESYDKIAPFLSINPSDVRTININEATVEELNAHPYINWGQANSIVKMRMQKVGFKDINEIKQSHLIDEETYEKLIPYLSI
jgi:competence protein ComEA